MSLVTNIKLRTLERLPVINRRKVGTTSNHHAPYVPGYTRTTMARTKGCKGASRSQSHKNRPSSDCRLQLACTKLELLVIADQHAAVNTFSGLVHTARHTMRAGNTRSRWPNRKEGAVEGRAGDWGQVVTRYPYENVGMDHLLSKEKEKYRRDDQRQIV